MLHVFLSLALLKLTYETHFLDYFDLCISKLVDPEQNTSTKKSQKNCTRPSKMTKKCKFPCSDQIDQAISIVDMTYYYV